MMVAAHVWDILGAQNVGFGTALDHAVGQSAAAG